MSTRIVYISIFAYLLLGFVKEYETKDLIHVGILWLCLTLVFEWAGSLAIGRPVQEILVGWDIFAGYMWPYVLMAYLLSNLIIGTVLHPGKKRKEARNGAESPSLVAFSAQVSGDGVSAYGRLSRRHFH